MGKDKTTKNLGIAKQKLLGVKIDRSLNFDKYVLKNMFHHYVRKLGKKCLHYSDTLIL